MEKAIQMNLLFDKFGVIFLSLYEYMLQDKKITVKNRPVEEVWNEDYLECANSAHFYESLKGELEEDSLQQLNAILSGDLCEVILNGEGCTGVREESKNGLLALNSLIVNAAADIKRSYDSSNKTWEAIYDIYQKDTLEDMEWAYWFYTPPAHLAIEGILKAQLVNSVQSYREKVTITVFCLVGGFCVMILFVWIPIWRLLLQERKLLKDFVLMLPHNCILDNNFLKAYIVTHAEKKI